ASFARIDDLLQEEPEIKDRNPRPLSMGDFRGAIRISSLTYHHKKEKALLNGISLEIPAGTSLGIIGPTGSGKSMFAHLLPRIYDPPRGSIFIDSFDLHEIPLETLRQLIGFVPQEAFLFSRSIQKNIAYGLSTDFEEGAERKLVEKAAQEAGLQGEIAGFPEGYQTMVGERGLTVSGGQRARTALARALIGDHPILILDDALANVDSETEHLILNELKTVIEQRTTIIIAHRIATVSLCDHIIVIEGGRITQQGTHESLLGQPGYYARTAKLQKLESELEQL
ncbi:MAG TPA: ABC transporter ATP-binding protein, partial [Bdellovibrionota bacterium]|nr:ABC transporter ATP-binding protein [Bdellovibrionota bacterium]